MNEHNTFHVATSDGQAALPFYFRLTSLVRLPAKRGKGVRNQATLYHDDAELTVNWTSAFVDTRLKRGCYVALRGARRGPKDGGLNIDRLERIDKPLAALNPFQTVPTTWFSDRDAIQRAIQLWERLDRPLQHLFNAVMWDGGRFLRFLTGPATTADYPWIPGQNLRHTVQVAERAIGLTKGTARTSVPIVIAAAFFHDAGKADDFRIADRGYVLSERGEWIGHQHTILEWLAVARAQVIVPERTYIQLIHALIAFRGSAANQRSLEAMILSTANRLDEEARSQLITSALRHN
jgi:3'-5' exoribonuclease